VSIDRRHLIDTLAALARVPSDVPLGETELPPNHAKITTYVREHLVPRLTAVGWNQELVDDWNNAVGRIGPPGPAPLLLMIYTTTQHGNFTDPTLEGQVMDGSGYGVNGLCVFGRGTSQCKGPTAAVLAAVKALRDSGFRPRRPLLIVVNAEGRSSHDCSRRLFDEHRVRADGAVVCIGTGNTIVLGNRGRVDLQVIVRGRSAHSSHPELGLNAIDGAGMVLSRLRELRFPKRHPQLGEEQLTVYKLLCSPVAPHTLPDTCVLTVDRRLLPGTDVEDAVAEVRSATAGLDPFHIEVRAGASMLPALVPVETPVVAALRWGHREVLGTDAETVHVRYTFDSGYACSQGVPTVMFGPSVAGRTRGLGPDVTATEFVPVSVVETAARIYASAIAQLCGGA
jgi:acetylornithine deacetylase/succinyl-diaminopimelate desuccinylase-like protein